MASCQPPIRKHPRLKALPRAMVLFKNGPEPQLPCHLIDISEGGLSYRYLGKMKKNKGLLSVSLYHEEDLIVDNLQAKYISDIHLYDYDVPIRRGSLCFEAPSVEQQNKLSTFIETFTESYQ